MSADVCRVRRTACPRRKKELRKRELELIQSEGCVGSEEQAVSMMWECMRNSEVRTSNKLNVDGTLLVLGAGCCSLGAEEAESQKSNGTA